jgi:hypothetical protein
MTELNLAGLRRIAEAANQGEWKLGELLPAGEEADLPTQTIDVEYLYHGRKTWHAEAIHVHIEPAEVNAKHIATFNPATVLKLLDRIEELERGLRTTAALVIGHTAFEED